MRSVASGHWIMTTLLILCTAGPVAAMQNACPTGCGPFAWDLAGIYGAPACMGPSYGFPGSVCCPCPAMTCCDRIWDGYCAERWRRHACRRGVPTCYAGPAAATACGAGCNGNDVPVVAPSSAPATQVQQPAVQQPAVQQPAVQQPFQSILPGPAPRPVPEPRQPAPAR